MIAASPRPAVPKTETQPTAPYLLESIDGGRHVVLATVIRHGEARFDGLILMSQNGEAFPVGAILIDRRLADYQSCTHSVEISNLP